jgi:hypothetical protein
MRARILEELPGAACAGERPRSLAALLALAPVANLNFAVPYIVRQAARAASN